MCDYFKQFFPSKWKIVGQKLLKDTNEPGSLEKK